MNAKSKEEAKFIRETGHEGRMGERELMGFRRHLQCLILSACSSYIIHHIDFWPTPFKLGFIDRTQGQYKLKCEGKKDITVTKRHECPFIIKEGSK